MTSHPGDTMIQCANKRCRQLFIWHEGSEVVDITKGRKKRGRYCPWCSELFKTLYAALTPTP